MAVLEYDNQLLVLTFQIITDLTSVDFCERQTNFFLIQLSENRKLMSMKWYTAKNDLWVTRNMD